MEPDDPDERKRALISLRSAFVLTLALLVALAAGGLLYAAHRSIALAVLGAGGAFAAAATLFNWMIELRPAMASRRRDVPTSGSGAPAGCLAWKLRIRLLFSLPACELSFLVLIA